jgi:hypothetical protein
MEKLASSNCEAVFPPLLSWPPEQEVAGRINAIARIIIGQFGRSICASRPWSLDEGLNSDPFDLINEISGLGPIRLVRGYSCLALRCALKYPKQEAALSDERPLPNLHSPPDLLLTKVPVKRDPRSIDSRVVAKQLASHNGKAMAGGFRKPTSDVAGRKRDAYIDG